MCLGGVLEKSTPIQQLLLSLVILKWNQYEMASDLDYCPSTLPKTVYSAGAEAMGVAGGT